MALARALAEPSRVRILAALQGGELCVCELCDALEMGQSTLSTHLQAIRRAGLVDVRRQGKWNYYSLSEPGRAWVEAVFGLFGGRLASDRGLKSDARRLAGRLRLRQGGACCVGYCGSGGGCG